MTEERGDAATTEAGRCVIDVPYLLALDVALYRDAHGGLWASPSWARDLIGHIRYLPRLTVIGIQLDGSIPADAVRLPDTGTRFLAARRGQGRRHFYLALPRLLWLLLRETRRARVVHSTLGYGEGFPYGWLAYPIAFALRRRTVCIIEASFWRLFPGERAGLKRRVEAWASERINRWIMARVDYAAYQHEEYRRSLPSPRAGGGELTQASWIAQEDVVALPALEARWAAQDGDRVPRLVFAARLVPEKGTQVLAAAIDLLAGMGVDLDLDLIGEGPDTAIFAALDGRRLGRGRVRHVGPVPYGAPFFEHLAACDLLVVPSLADEQPRIVYDAGSVGVGAIVSDTAGLRSCVDGESATIVPRNDPAALAEAIAATVRQPGELRRLGRGARRMALANTHERMHETRCTALRAMLARG